MANPSLRFDDITETYHARELADARALAESWRFEPPVSIEIGSNRGLFLRKLAQENPERSYLGIELRPKFAQMANEAFAREGITNAHILACDAALAMPILFDDASIGELFVLYPDPWWKGRHRKRRIIRPDFLDLLAPKMIPGGKLWIRTDVGPLANDMRGVLNEHAAFEVMPLDEYPQRPFLRSERELRTLSLQMPVHVLYYKRRGEG
jgi:tRNA (guanine-N7-)-methyltransferase